MAATDVYGTTTALTVFNLPNSVTDDYVHSLFPSARSVNLVGNQSDPSGFQSMCVLKFNSPYECQQAYSECRGGKEVAGRMLYAELGENHDSDGRQIGDQNRKGDVSSTFGRRQSTELKQSFSERSSSDERRPNAGCNLTLSNLPYSASERDVLKEFPEALKVVLNLDERGRSRGVAQLSFSSKEQCNAAYESCNYKTMDGRPIRGRMTNNTDNSGGRQGERRGDYGGRGRQNDFGDRGNRFNDQRSFGTRPNRFNEDSRDFGGRQGSQSNYDRDRDNRFNSYDSRGGHRGDSNYRGYRGRGGGGNRDERLAGAGRRERSPPRDEPVRGYGNNKGPRITSAVINRPGDHSPKSSSSSDED